MTDVVVAVPTYRRPESLTRLLPLLVEQATAIGGRVLVVDNDPLGGARSVVDALGSPAVEYVQERTPNLSAVRNRALDAAHGADALVFIDDDELPRNDWLQRLVVAWEQWRCAAVSAPVEPVFPPGADPWLDACCVLARPVRPTGRLLTGAASNNLLLDLRHIGRLGVRFDPRFGVTGGEDTMFAHELIQRGGEIRWCDEAVVDAPVELDRIDRRWMLRRAFRTGATWARVAVFLRDPTDRRLTTYASLIARGLFRGAGGLGRVVMGVLRRDLVARAAGLAAVATGVGLVAGTFGLSAEEYGRPVTANCGQG